MKIGMWKSVLIMDIDMRDEGDQKPEVQLNLPVCGSIDNLEMRKEYSQFIEQLQIVADLDKVRAEIMALLQGVRS